MRKKITILSQQQQALKAIANNENGADLKVLEVLASAIISGEVIEPDFQLVANAIISQSVIFGKLPPKRKGRPVHTGGVTAYDVASQYYKFRDNGVSYTDAVAKTSAKFHKDERHIMRLVKEGKTQIGGTPDERKGNRELLQFSAALHQSAIDSGRVPVRDQLFGMFREIHERNLQRDPIAELDVLIVSVIDRIGIADKNIVGFIASD